MACKDIAMEKQSKGILGLLVAPILILSCFTCWNMSVPMIEQRSATRGYCFGGRTEKRATGFCFPSEGQQSQPSPWALQESKCPSYSAHCKGWGELYI